MNKIFVFLIALTILVFFGCTQANPTLPQDNNIPIVVEKVVQEKSTTPEAPAGTPQTYIIAIRNFNFNPATLTINKGDTVIWANEDSMGHTVTSTAKQFTTLNSPTLEKGQTYSQTFNMPESIDYICTIHPSMKGKVIVQ